MTPSPGKSRHDSGGGGVTSPGGLGRRFLLGAVYIGTGSWLTYTLSFAIQIAIARLLGPSELGLYAYVFAINEFINIVGAFSLGAALIQAREESQRLYDTGLALCAVLGALGLLLALALAPLLGTWRSEQAAWFLLSMAIARIAVLLSRVPNAQLQRSLQFGQLSVIAVLAGNLPNLAALGLAMAGLGAWSLVIRDVGVAILTLILTFAWSSYRFRRCVDMDSARRLMVFSRPMFVSRSLDIVLERVDRVAMGSFFGNTAMGLYHQARFLAEAGLLATRPVSQLSFNLYARLQDAREPLSRSYELVSYFLVRVTFMGALVLIVAPAETVHLLLGEGWSDMAPLLRALGVYAAILPVLENVKQLFFGVGEVTRNVRIRIFQIATFVPVLLLGCLVQSLLTISLALVGTTLLGFGLAWRYSGDLIRRPALHVLGIPTALLLVGSAAFATADVTGALTAVPWFFRPLLPAIAYALALLAIERATLLRELRYLRKRLLTREPQSTTPDPHST